MCPVSFQEVGPSSFTLTSSDKLGASHKKLWKSPSVEVSHSVADFAKVPPYILVVKDKGKPKSIYSLHLRHLLINH
jgi:hypothetical protein